MNIKPASWTVGHPCINNKIKPSQDKAVEIDKSNFIHREEVFGTLLYPKSAGPTYQGGYFIENEYSGTMILNAPVRLDIELTYQCYHNCIHCYLPNKKNVHMDKNMAIELLHEAKEINVIGVQFIGGEPYCYPHIVELVDIAKKLGLKVEIFTSAFGIKKDNILATRDFLDRVAISLDGSLSIHNAFRGHAKSYDSVLEAIDLFTGHSSFTSVATVVTRLNVDEIPFIYNIVNKLGVDSLELNAFKAVGQGMSISKYHIPFNELVGIIENKISSLEGTTQIRKPDILYTVGKFTFFGCGSRTFTAVINPFGNLLRCNFVRKDYGNISDMGLKKLWNYSNQVKLSQLAPKCKSCLYQNRCGGFCDLHKINKV